jgi:hypothetical protein
MHIYIVGFFGQMKIGLLKVRSFYVRSNGIGLLKLGLLGGHRRELAAYLTIQSHIKQNL